MKLGDLMELQTGNIWVCDHDSKSMVQYFPQEVPDSVMKKDINMIGVCNYDLFVEVGGKNE